MCQLMTNNVDIAGEAGEDSSITIAVNHTPAIPVGIIHSLIKMHILFDEHPFVIN